MAKSFYETLKSLGVPLDHHESDLYVLDTPASRIVIRQFGRESTAFTSQIDGKRWFDIPFAYEPFWTKVAARSKSMSKVAARSKSKRSHATVTAPVKSKRVPKTKVIHVIQGYYGHGWEDVTAEDTRKEALVRLREYRANESAPFRLIRRRERINP